MDAITNMLTRRSIRKYKSDMIPKDIIGKIIAGNNIAAQLVSLFDDGEYESRSAQYHKFFHISLSFFRFKRLFITSSR